MNDGILDFLNKKYGLELVDNDEIKDKPQQMTEVNKLRFQNITYTAAKSKFEEWRMRRGLKSKIEEKIKSYEEEVSTERREDLAADIAILMSKYKFLKTNEGESPEIIERRAIRLNQGMIDKANGRVSVILKELDREAKKERVKSEQKATEAVEESSEGELVQEEIVSEVPKEEEEIDEPSELDGAKEVDLEVEEVKDRRKTALVIPVEDINRYNKQIEKDNKGKDILRIPFVEVKKINKKQKGENKEILRIPLRTVVDYNKSKDDKGVIAQGMTDKEIEASKKLLKETAPKTKEEITTFKATVPRERNEGETTREYGRYLAEFYKNLKEDYSRSISGTKEDEPEKYDEPKGNEKSNQTNYRDEINELKKMAASLREQVDATKEAKRQVNKSVEETKKAAEERRIKEEDEVKKAQYERAKAEEQRRKKQEAMKTVIEQFKAYLEGMKKEIEATQKDIENAKAEELKIRDASEKESAKNSEKKAEAYRGRDEANESISSQEAYIQDMLSSMV